MFIRGIKMRTFKLIEGKNCPTTFLPLNANIGGQSKPNRNTEKIFGQKNRLDTYKTVESGNTINISTKKQEIDQD